MLIPPRCQRGAVQYGAGDGDPSLLRRKKSDQKIGECGLAGTRRSGDADDLAGLQRQADALHPIGGSAAIVRGMAEGNVAEVDGALRQRRRHGMPQSSLRHRRELVLEFLGLFIGRQRMSELQNTLLNLSDRADHAGDDQDERDQRRRREMENAKAEQHKQPGSQRRYGGKHDAYPRLLPEVIDLPKAQLAQRLAEFLDEPLLQVLAHRQLQSAEELRRRIEQR